MNALKNKVGKDGKGDAIKGWRSEETSCDLVFPHEDQFAFLFLLVFPLFVSLRSSPQEKIACTVWVHTVAVQDSDCVPKNKVGE